MRGFFICNHSKFLMNEQFIQICVIFATKPIKMEMTDQYQGLFNLMSDEHELSLTISEMDEIIIEAKKVVEKINQQAEVGAKQDEITA